MGGGDIRIRMVLRLFTLSCDRATRVIKICKPFGKPSPRRNTERLRLVE
ncbi:hypothetical protein Aca07nite_73160 [Actinoplanes capillaceus]|uniref:Uncharacterized protein n=1 Tax=Actinoplanes campanulatus TaxID=113559 RepID=A0ABQ3WUR3_9ACTN|nr:hypothetical protein [Actinoplanes capillaceus]GID50041.1 hypothetical protein Aca07nite_73160 [Actinoplanes capillaceus]